MSGAATPHAPASARASLPPTGAATPALQPPAASASASASQGLPPPTTFDILPDLHSLLKRLIDPAPPSASTQPGADGPLEIQHVATAATDAMVFARLKASLRELGRPAGAADDGDQRMTG